MICRLFLFLPGCQIHSKCFAIMKYLEWLIGAASHWERWSNGKLKAL